MLSSALSRLAVMTLASATLVLSSGRAAAAEPAGPPDGDPDGALAQEIVGLELTPVSLRLTDTPVLPDTSTPSRVQAGLGGTVRLLRHRWQHAYVTPIEGGIYVSGGGDSRRTVLLSVAAEGGLIVPGTDGRLEVGLAAGAGILTVDYGTTCDGTCARGGAGAMISPVLRVLVLDRPNFSVGANLRAIVPLSGTHTESISTITGFGSIALLGLDFAYGLPGPRAHGAGVSD